MLAAAQFLAVLSCTIFAGAALYINLVEHPARMGCGTETALPVWAPSYQRAVRMQAPLAVISFIAGIVAWMFGASILWLVGALLIGAVVPFTFLVIMPTNKRLYALANEPGRAETHGVLERWGRLHAIRSILSLMASCLYLGLLVRI